MLASLSGRGLSQVPRLQFRDNFTFIVGSSRFPCDSIVADYLSGKIARLHASDASISEYTISSISDGGQFTKFLSLGLGGAFEIPTKELPLFSLLFAELENSELCALISTFLEKENNCDNIIEKVKLRIVQRQSVEDELDFAASHFYEIPAASLRTANTELLYDILSRECLRIESEDLFYSFIAERLSDSADAFALLEFVRFEFLTPSALSEFVEVSVQFLGELNCAIWRKICTRLVPNAAASVGIDSRYAIVTGAFSGNSALLPYRPNFPFEGIIAYLTKKCRGNVHDRRIVKIESSPVEETRPDHAAKTVADLGDLDSRFVSADGGERWISYDFKNMKVTPTHYSLRSGPSGAFLVSWVVEGSEDGGKWVELDRREAMDDLNGNSRAATFPVFSGRPFRFIRLMQVGKNGRGIDCFALSAFELFGTLYE
jgi:hypothetical protein